MLPWQELRQLSDAHLSKVDLAIMNLACAVGLPGAAPEAMDALSARLDEWTECVRATQAVVNPNGKSLAYYQVQQLVEVLRDAVRAAGSISADTFLADDQGADVLIFDLLNGTSCSRSAFLVLCVAIGRSLGYPLKLLATKGEKFFYLFARWDDGKGGPFNVDVSAEGLCSRSDEYYRTGRYEVPPRPTKDCRLMTPLKPQEELAFFLASRGFQWEALGDYRKALDAFAWASAINTWNAALRQLVNLAILRWRDRLKPRFPQGFPNFTVGTVSRRYPMSLAFEQEQAILLNEALETLLGDEELDKQYWEPMRKGLPTTLRPAAIHVVHSPARCDVKMVLKAMDAATKSDCIAEMLNPGFLEERRAEAEFYRTTTPTQEKPQTVSDSPKPAGDGPLTIERLVRMPEEELAQVDIAEMNLLCAKGLPGTKDLDIPACLRKIDEWADYSRDIIERNVPRFESHPEEFNHSWATFRVVTMVVILQRKFGMKYNQDRKKNLMGDDFFDRPEDIFLHGLLSGNGGTCSSIPVLCVAIGRRLGYPLTLADTAQHLFFRWDEPGGERVNFEAASDLGLNTYTDEHYRHWPVEVPPEIEEPHCYLRSQTPREELSSFLTTRAFCWRGNGNYCKALKCMGWASLLAQDNNGSFCRIVDNLGKWTANLQARLANGLPRLGIHGAKRVWRNLPWEMEMEIVRNSVLEDLLRDYRFKKLVDRVKKNGKLPDWAPKEIAVTYPDRLIFDI